MEWTKGGVSIIAHLNAVVRFYWLTQLSLELEWKVQQELLDIPEAEPGPLERDHDSSTEAQWLSSSPWGPAEDTAELLQREREMLWGVEGN